MHVVNARGATLIGLTENLGLELAACLHTLPGSTSRGSPIRWHHGDDIEHKWSGCSSTPSSRR